MKLHNPDQLVECLNRLLEEGCPDGDAPLFIERVTEEYLMDLIQQGHIPLRYLNTLRDDVRVEVQDLLQIRAYGFHSLTDYLRQYSKSLPLQQRLIGCSPAGRRNNRGGS